MSRSALEVIGEQLELIDLALEAGKIEEVSNMSWRPPGGNETDRDEMTRLLAWIEDVKHRVWELRAETVAAQKALEMKRQVARLYSGESPDARHAQPPGRQVAISP